jgi:hypothetical protein
MPKFYKTDLLSSKDDSDDDYAVKTWIEWDAPSRPFRRKNRSFYTTVIIIVALISVIAILAGEYLLIGVLLAFVFLVYVLNFVEPGTIHNKITSEGVTIGEHFYHWNELDSFWFSEKEGHKMLNIVTNLRFPGMLIIVLGSADLEEVKKVCIKYLPFHEIVPKTLMDKWSDSLQKHFPLENPHK